MPQFLLMIKKRKWDKLDVRWLQPNHIQADPLGDLSISDGTLSVWHIEDDKSNLEPVITALAATRHKFDKFEYGLFDQEAINPLGVLAKMTPGNTPVEKANGWHRDLIELTIDKASRLVKTIFNNLEKERLFADDIKNRILDAVHTGDIDLQNLNKSLRKKIEEVVV